MGRPRRLKALHTRDSPLRSFDITKIGYILDSGRKKSHGTADVSLLAVPISGGSVVETERDSTWNGLRGQAAALSPYPRATILNGGGRAMLLWCSTGEITPYSTRSRTRNDSEKAVLMEKLITCRLMPKCMVI